MAKSPSEQIRDLSLEVRGLVERDAARERLITRVLESISELEDQIGRLEVENAAQKQLLQVHLTQYQERERRQWSFLLVLAGAVLSLASGLIVTLVKK